MCRTDENPHIFNFYDINATLKLIVDDAAVVMETVVIIPFLPSRREIICVCVCVCVVICCVFDFHVALNIYNIYM